MRHAAEDRITDAAGADADNGAIPSGKGAETGNMRIARDADLGEAWAGGADARAILRAGDAGEAETGMDARHRCAVEPGCSERRIGCPQDRAPSGFQTE